MAAPSLQHQITEELTLLNNAMEELLGRQSRWNGSVSIEPFAMFSGTKRYDCSISILEAVARQPILRWRTLIHELLHAFSPQYTRAEYDRFIGWEEGVVEQCQRLLRADILYRIGISVDVDVMDVEERLHPYNRYIIVLEDLRVQLNLSAQEFYPSLLATELSMRTALLMNLGDRLKDAQARANFRTALLIAQGKLSRK